MVPCRPVCLFRLFHGIACVSCWSAGPPLVFLFRTRQKRGAPVSHSRPGDDVPLPSSRKRDSHRPSRELRNNSRSIFVWCVRGRGREGDFRRVLLFLVFFLISSFLLHPGKTPTSTSRTETPPILIEVVLGFFGGEKRKVVEIVDRGSGCREKSRIVKRKGSSKFENCNGLLGRGARSKIGKKIGRAKRPKTHFGKS